MVILLSITMNLEAIVIFLKIVIPECMILKIETFEIMFFQNMPLHSCFIILYIMLMIL